MSTFRHIIEDFKIFKLVHPKKILFNIFYLPSFKIVLIFRLSQLCYKSKILIPVAYLLTVFNDTIHDVWIGPRVTIGKGFYLGHPRGLIVNPNVKIGEYCSIIQQVTLGGPKTSIGNYVAINAGAKIISDPLKDNEVKIGDNCIIGAGSVVVNSMPENSIVIGVPAKVVKTMGTGVNWLTLRKKINEKN